MNDDFFNKVATAQAVESPQIGQDSFFDHVANYQKYEPDFKIREAESVFDFVRNNAENEDAEAIIGITDFISKRYNVSAKNAIDNIDTYLADYMGKTMPKKEAWQQIKDGYTEGRITDRLGRLYNRLMYAKDENQRKSIEFEIEKLEARMPSRAGNTTTGITPWIESASNLFGTMVRPLMISTMVGLGTAGLGSIPAVASFAGSAPMIANIGARVLSMAPTFNETRKVETGLIYKDMIENGVPEQIAKKNAIAHGMIAGALETASIEVLLARFPFMKKLAQNAFMRLTARERMTQGAVKAIGKIIADNALSLPIGIVSETATEALQEYSAVHFEKRADLQSIDDKELAKIMADKQGEFEKYFDEEFRQAKKDYYVSDEYAQEVKDRIWEVMKQTAKGMTVFGLVGGGFNATTDIVSNTRTVGKYKKTYENLEQLKTDTDKLRDKRNQLRDELNADPGNAEKKAAYEKANEELASSERQLNMTDNEREFAELVAKPELSEDELDRLRDLNDMLGVKRDFERENEPNYEKEPQDIQHAEPQTVDVGEKRFREIVKAYTPDVTEEQTDEIINLLNARARSLDQDLDTYLNNTFQAEMANYTTEDTATITENGKERTVRFKGNVDFAKDGKAIITLTQNADFTTWVHEIGHIFRRQIGGDMLSEAERHYGVQDGVWTVEAEERFTEDFTEYLRTRRAPNSTLEKMFRIIADALNDIYDRFRARGQVSDDIARVFDEMLGDGQSAFADPYSNVDSMLYQITGERGARELDLQEEVTTRMDNLLKAKEMQKKNYGSKYIRMATGWEQGKDKKWRYEIPDIKLTNPVFKSGEKITDKENELEEVLYRQDILLSKPQFEWTYEDRKESRDIQESIKKIDAELKEMRQDREKYISDITGKERPITEFIDGDVLKAYPDIKDKVVVEFRPEDQMDGAYGAYYESDDKIAVSASLINNLEKLQSVLAHEIQHAVQAEEGFYRGGSEELFTTTDLAEQQKKMASLAPEEREALERKISRAGMRGKVKYVDLSPFGINEFVEPYEAYQRIAGEVEARNVEERLFKSDEYRKKYLLKDTEDRPRTQQISVERLYQPAFHGSGANFEQFSTDFIGTGEGAQAFGWGIYLTQSEGIARSYAEKLADKRVGEKYEFTVAGKKIDQKLHDIIRGFSWMYSKDLTAEENNERAREVLSKAIGLYRKQIKTDEKVADGITKTINTLEKDKDITYKELKKKIETDRSDMWLVRAVYGVGSYEIYYNSPLPESKKVEKVIDNLKGSRQLYLDSIKDIKNIISKLEKIDINSFEISEKDWRGRNLYTTTIPDDTGSNYLYWDKPVKDDALTKIYNAVRKYGTDKFDFGQDFWTGKSGNLESGEELYLSLAFELGSDKAASEFLSEAGFAGISYPANATTGGNKYGKRNYVIFNASDIQIDNHKLYQLEEDTYRTATRNGQYVPDNILANMRGAEWVENELAAREDFRKDALNYDSYEAFLEAQIKSGINRSDDYFENIWNTATEIYPDYKAMLPSLTRRMVERILYTLKRISERENRKLGWPWNDLIKNYSKDHMISEDSYRSLIAQMKSDPDAYIELISDCFADQAEFEEMMKSLWLHPDLEVERIKELERAIRGDKKLAEAKISQLEDRIDRIKRNYREREIYKKLVRAIFRKPAKMCDVQIAMQIQAIQAGLSPTSMRETTRLKLELELQNTTDERRKAKIRSLMERKSLRDMTLLEIAQVADMITQLRHEGVQKRMEQLLAKKEERLGIIDGLGEDLDVSDTLDKTGSIESKDNKGSLVNRMKGYWWDINRIAEDMGPHWKAFFAERVGQAYQDELVNVARRRQAFLDKIKELKITTLSDIETIDGAEGEKTYTHDILLHWYICKQNEDSYAALLYGNFKNIAEETAERTIDEGISRLSEQEIELAEWMMNSFSGDDRARLWEQFMAVENRCPEMVVRYFPMKRQLDHIADVQADPLVDLGERTPAGRVAVRKGFSWDRLHNINKENQKPLKLGAMSTYLQAIQDQEHYIAFAQLSKDMKYCYEKVADKVIAKYGKNFYDDLNKWIDRVINPNAYKARYAQQNIFMKALANSMAGALAGNVVTMIKQAPSMLFFLPYTDAGHMAHSLYEFATNRKGLTEFAKSKSPYLANRNIDDFLTRLADDLADPNSRYRKAKEVTDALLKPIKWIDEFACVVGWNAVYTSEMGKGATEAEAVAKANEALIKTQPQATAIFSPQAYNSGSDLMRTMLVFTRQANQIFQMITADIGHLAAEKQFKQIISMGFVLGLNALVMGWISRKFAGYGDDDDSAIEDMTKDIIANLANNIPVVGPTIVPMIQRSAYTSSGYVNPISEMLNKTHRAIYKSISIGEIDNDAAMRLITDAMGVAGLPKVLTWRAYKALKDEDIWTLFIGAPLGGKNGGK